MTCNLRTRPVAVLLIIGMLGCAGCERSQPGPKPISGTAASAAPGAPADTPGAPASGQPR
ncbi:hypothetical protein [Cupriavidus necator]|uniref:hypothetical protein n=1 Tax=Cupriavidus necator TaxID=106590 RepID=UPI001D016399|nr:hypothetical protein [Cupriavidus necator]